MLCVWTQWPCAAAEVLPTLAARVAAADRRYTAIEHRKGRTG